MITLAIPVINKFDLTKKAISYALKNAETEFELIIIDNASDPDYVSEWVANGNPDVIPLILRNNQNVGVPESFAQAALASHVDSDVVVCIHNDVFIHDPEWISKITNAFAEDSDLVVAGFFGALKLLKDGGRRDCMSNLLGIEGGEHAMNQGLPLDSVYPAAVLDGLGMCFRKEWLLTQDFSYLPPHHWYDRIIPLTAINQGFHVATIGVACDHVAGGTAGEKEYIESATSWARNHNETVGPTVDPEIYGIGQRIFERMFGDRKFLTVDHNYNYTWDSIRP